MPRRKTAFGKELKRVRTVDRIGGARVLAEQVGFKKGGRALVEAYENGRKIPSHVQATKIARALGKPDQHFASALIEDAAAAPAAETTVEVTIGAATLYKRVGRAGWAELGRQLEANDKRVENGEDAALVVMETKRLIRDMVSKPKR